MFLISILISIVIAVGATGNVTYGGLKYFCDLCPGGVACDATGLVASNAGETREIGDTYNKL